MTLHVQFLTMVSMIGGGIYLGAALDTHRRLSSYWRKSKVLAYFIELLFWMLQTIVLFYLLFRVNHGELRFYVFLAGLLGFSMYQVFFNSLYKKVLEFVIRVFVGIYKFVKGLVQAILIRPVIGLLKIVIVIILSIVQLIGTVLYWTFRVVFFPFLFVIRFIARFMPNNAKKFLHNTKGIYSTIRDRCSTWLKKMTSKRR